MRADRLVATLLLLQARGRVTAAEVAEALEVSERTARRDLEALGVAGIPVYSQQGRNGGWSLIGGARTDLTGLKADEARALFLVAGPSSVATPELKAALRKLVRALPEPMRRSAETASGAVVIDPAAWGEVKVAGKTPYHLAPLQQAVVDELQVVLGYQDRDGNASERVVHPLGLVAKGGVWYLVANTENGQRTFRVGRVRSVVPTTDPVVRPDDFDLQAAWDAIATEVDARRSPFHTRAFVDRDALDYAQWAFGGRLQEVGDAGDGRAEVELRGGSAFSLATELAGFGGRVEAVDPAVRAELRRIAGELQATYGEPTD
jgi:predicted DNA-binding transcriptional regulator YafY